VKREEYLEKRRTGQSIHDEMKKEFENWLRALPSIDRTSDEKKVSAQRDQQSAVQVPPQKSDQ